MTVISDLRQFIQTLRLKKELIEVKVPVDPYLEIAEIHRRVAAANGPALLFTQVKGSSFPVVTNLFGSKERVHAAFPNEPEKILKNLVQLIQQPLPPSLKKIWQERSLIKKILRVGMKQQRQSPILQNEISPPNLEQLPFLKLWPEDGGSFLTLPLVYTEHPDHKGPNLGMYRIQRYDKATTGLHWQIGKGGGFHYHAAEQKGASLPVTIFLGGPPALVMSAIAPLPENLTELLLASFLMGDKLPLCKLPGAAHKLIASCEFAMLGEAKPYERRPEGPFGDHYGYYSLQHPFPVFHCNRLLHRKDAIYPATVVGKPLQEDFYIGQYLQELLSPLFPMAMPGVKDLWSYGETGFHSLSAAVVRERYGREAMTHAFRILGEGQLSLTKFLLLTDTPIDVKNFKVVLTTVLERCQFQKDLFIFSNLSLDTLDYTGPKLNEGSRGIMLGVGPKIRELPTHFEGPLPSSCQAAIPFCPGCLVIQTASFSHFQDFSKVTAHPPFSKWPLLILVDDLHKALKNEASFLWTVFTRFEPAADIFSASHQVFRHHIAYEPPILIDARFKPSYPKEVLCDESTDQLVTKRWLNYFHEKVEMGNSYDAHVS